MSSMIRSAARTARSGSSSWASGTPNTPTTASPMNFSTTPPWDSMRLAADRLVVAEQAGDVFGVEALPQGGGADEIAEQGGDDLALFADGGRFELGSALPAEVDSVRVLRAAGRAGQHRARAYVGCANRLKGSRCYAATLRGSKWPGRRGRLTCGNWWALRVSNPRPSPCKGEEEVLVRGLSRDFACHRSALVYLGVLLSCYAKCYAESVLLPTRGGGAAAPSVPTNMLLTRKGANSFDEQGAGSTHRHHAWSSRTVAPSRMQSGPTRERHRSSSSTVCPMSRLFFPDPATAADLGFARSRSIDLASVARTPRLTTVSQTGLPTSSPSPTRSVSTGSA